MLHGDNTVQIVPTSLLKILRLITVFSILVLKNATDLYAHDLEHISFSHAPWVHRDVDHILRKKAPAAQYRRRLVGSSGLVPHPLTELQGWLVQKCQAYIYHF